MPNKEGSYFCFQRLSLMLQTTTKQHYINKQQHYKQTQPPNRFHTTVIVSSQWLSLKLQTNSTPRIQQTASLTYNTSKYLSSAEVAKSSMKNKKLQRKAYSDSTKAKIHAK